MTKKRINTTEQKCTKCGKDTKPLFNIERYCPTCEGDEKRKGSDPNDPYGFQIIDLIEIGSEKDRDEITQPMHNKKGYI